MTFRNQSEKLPKETALRVIEESLRGLRKGRMSSRNIRELLCCESCSEMDGFTQYLEDRTPFIRGQISKVVAIRSPEKVVEAILKEKDVSALRLMIQGLEDVKYQEVDDLAEFLKNDDCILAERIFELFVGVDRADLLFGLAVGGDDKTVERVKRYLDEQGWLK
jgi:hypothetical protein